MKNPVKRDSLFLMELVLDLFIFVLCAAVCVGLLIHARTLSRRSTELTDAVYLAQTAAEAFRACPTTEELARSLGGRGSASTLSIRCGADGTPDPEGAYVVEVETSVDAVGGIWGAEITVSRPDGFCVYLLSAACPTEVSK